MQWHGPWLESSLSNQLETFSWGHLNMDGVGNVIKEIMSIVRCNNSDVVRHEKVFLKKDTCKKYLG